MCETASADVVRPQSIGLVRSPSASRGVRRSGRFTHRRLRLRRAYWRHARHQPVACTRTLSALCGLVPWHLLPGGCNGLTLSRAILGLVGDLGAATLSAGSRAGWASPTGRGADVGGLRGSRRRCRALRSCGGLSIAARPPLEWRWPLCRSRASGLPCDFDLRLATWRRICAVRSARHPWSAGGVAYRRLRREGLGADRGYLNDVGVIRCITRRPFAPRRGGRLGDGSRRRAAIGSDLLRLGARVGVRYLTRHGGRSLLRRPPSGGCAGLGQLPG